MFFSAFSRNCVTPGVLIEDLFGCVIYGDVELWPPETAEQPEETSVGEKVPAGWNSRFQEEENFTIKQEKDCKPSK